MSIIISRFAINLLILTAKSSEFHRAGPALVDGYLLLRWLRQGWLIPSMKRTSFSTRFVPSIAGASQQHQLPYTIFQSFLIPTKWGQASSGPGHRRRQPDCGVYFLIKITLICSYAINTGVDRAGGSGRTLPSWITTRSTSEIARGAVSPLDPRNLPWDDFDNHLPSDEDHLWRVGLLLPPTTTSSSSSSLCVTLAVCVQVCCCYYIILMFKDSSIR